MALPSVRRPRAVGGRQLPSEQSAIWAGKQCAGKAITFVAQGSHSASGREDPTRWGWSGKVMRVTGERREGAGSPNRSEARCKGSAWQDEACCTSI